MGVYTTWTCGATRAALDGNKVLSTVDLWLMKSHGSSATGRKAGDLFALVLSWAEEKHRGATVGYIDLVGKILAWLMVMPAQAPITSHADPAADDLPWVCTCGMVSAGWAITDIYTGDVEMTEHQPCTSVMARNYAQCGHPVEAPANE